jgi:hypothetical protein
MRTVTACPSCKASARIQELGAVAYGASRGKQRARSAWQLSKYSHTTCDYLLYRQVAHGLHLELGTKQGLTHPS